METKNKSKITHGTIDSYSNHKCRCALCVAANAAYIKERRVVYKLIDKDKGFAHGTAANYATGCRCSACRKTDTEKYLPNGRLRSQVEYWKSTTASADGEKLKVTVYLTRADRQMIAKLGKRENIENITAIVRWALKRAWDRV